MKPKVRSCPFLRLINCARLGRRLALVVVLVVVGATAAVRGPLAAPARADYYGCYIGGISDPTWSWVGQVQNSSFGRYTGGAYAMLRQGYHPYPLYGHSSAFVQIADTYTLPVDLYVKTGMWGAGGTNRVYREWVSGAEPW